VQAGGKLRGEKIKQDDLRVTKKDGGGELE
jgi:hypothetical protein